MLPRQMRVRMEVKHRPVVIIYVHFNKYTRVEHRLRPKIREGKDEKIFSMSAIYFSYTLYFLTH